MQQRLNLIGRESGHEFKADQVAGFQKFGDFSSRLDLLHEKVILDKQGPLENPHLDHFLVL